MKVCLISCLIVGTLLPQSFAYLGGGGGSSGGYGGSQGGSGGYGGAAQGGSSGGYGGQVCISFE